MKSVQQKVVWWKRLIRQWIVFFLLASSTCVSAQEDLLQELSRLITTGQLNGAETLFKEIEKEASGRPDVEFYRGVLLAEQGKASEAMAVYRRLIENFPEMPEAHNNLGVVLASQGFLEQARESFIRAVRAYPAYGVAHENLADLYVRMANMSYAQAVKHIKNSDVLIKKKESISFFVFDYGLERKPKTNEDQKPLSPNAPIAKSSQQ
jgi:tetratricopeptide (TPR) repeat protein